MKNLLTLNLTINLLFLFCFSVSISAENYFVSSVLGSNSNNGLSDTKPKGTIQSAVNLTVPGDTVFVMNGTYNSTFGPVVNLLPANSGSAGKYITYKAYRGHKPKITASGNVWNAVSINASYVVFEGFELEGNNSNITYEAAYQSYQNYLNNIRNWAIIANYNTNGISIGGPGQESKLPHHVTIRNCIIHDFPGGGLSSIQADYTTFENNLIYNNAWYMMYGGSGISILCPYDSDNSTTYRNIIRNNICHTNKTTIPWASAQKLSDGNGIIIDVNVTGYSGGPTTSQIGYKGRTLVENNLSINNGGSGIHSYKADHVDIVNNTAYHNGTVVGYPDIFTNNCNDVNITNNIMYSRDGGQCNSNPKNSTEVYDYNLYFNGSVGKLGANDLVGDPQFISLSLIRSEGNFRLSENSPAINSGTSGICAKNDLEGRRRPVGGIVDRGAFEYDIALKPEAVYPMGNSLRVYPNPTAGKIFMSGESLKNIEKVEILSLSGKLEKTWNFYQQENSVINIGSLSSGMYVLKIFGSDCNEVVKIIKL